jgi:hypothetical protein
VKCGTLQSKLPIKEKIKNLKIQLAFTPAINRKLKARAKNQVDDKQ